MILDTIVDNVQQRVAKRKKLLTATEMEKLAVNSKPGLDFGKALKGNNICFIAEVKRASPSKGWINPNIKVSSLVQSYERGGAAAVSVLTESDFFKGEFDDVREARANCKLPILCKDFILEPYQIYEARYSGADAVLLISAILSLPKLKSLKEEVKRFGMAALVEVHNEEELNKAMAAEANIIGINNRNLKDFTVNMEVTLRLRSLIPYDIIVVSESGIKTREDVLHLEKAGINAVLIGETLVKSETPESKLRELKGQF